MAHVGLRDTDTSIPSNGSTIRTLIFLKPEPMKTTQGLLLLRTVPRQRIKLAHHLTLPAVIPPQSKKSVEQEPENGLLPSEPREPPTTLHRLRSKSPRSRIQALLFRAKKSLLWSKRSESVALLRKPKNKRNRKRLVCVSSRWTQRI